jgi:hypothetical protein
VYPTRAVGWSGTLWALELGGKPLSRIADRGSMRQAPESCWWWRCRTDMCSGVLLLSSHASDDDGTTESTLPVAWRRCRVMLAMALPRRRWPWCDVVAWVMLVMALLRRHWPWHDVAAESCWRLRCRVDVSRCMMSLSMTMLMWHLVWSTYKYCVKRK